MSGAHHTPRQDYDVAFSEGVQACKDGGSPDANPYDDWSFDRALKHGWREGFAAQQNVRAEWGGENHARALGSPS